MNEKNLVRNIVNKKTESCIQIFILIAAVFAFAYLVNPENINNVKQKTELGKLSLIESILSKIAAKIITPMIPEVSAETITQTVCCEKLQNGAWCQNADSSQCDQAYKQSPTSCDATSFCKNGCCYDSSEGTCAENTPQNVCNANGGTWADSASCEIPQCNLGCCVLDTQAAFVSLTRCKKLSGFYGLETDFRPSINNELECIATTQLLDRGACVYDVDFIKECKFTTRGNCKTESVEINGTITGNFSFYKDYLCSAEELGTKCGPSKQTTCVPGKDEVYFIDSCGNPANIYDSSKATDKSYWKKVIPKTESCGAGNTNGNADSKSCGNCDYFSGSFCRASSFGNKASLGNYICSDLNCANTYDGNDYRNGESWCVNDKDENSVGARYFKHVCANGEEILEPCADFRQEVCLEDSISTGKGKFSQAGCIANMWQDCTKQTEKLDCENIDKRDCEWVESSIGLNIETKEGEEPKEVSGVCIPKNEPGLKHYEESDAVGICSQANTQCIVTFEKGLLGKEKCVENCECLEADWEQERNKICSSLGDCGGKKNFVGASGYKAGYNVTKTDIDVSKLFLPLAKLASFVLFGEVEVVRGGASAPQVDKQENKDEEVENINQGLIEKIGRNS